MALGLWWVSEEALRRKRQYHDGVETALHDAAYYNRKEVVELLIGKGADVNMKREGGWTPFHDAARYGCKEIVELLIAHGADVNAKDKDGDTPLDEAISNDETETADLLCNHGGKTGEALKASGN